MPSLNFQVDPMSGTKITLQLRDKVEELLRFLDRSVAAPIADRFGLKYSLIGEFHPQAKRAGMTYRTPIRLSASTVNVIRIRLRSRDSPESKLLGTGTLLAVLLHELCHLKHMNHGEDFALFVRDVYRFADETLGVLKQPDRQVNELPSPWPWENLVFKRRGKVSDDELMAALGQPRVPSAGLPPVVADS